MKEQSDERLAHAFTKTVERLSSPETLKGLCRHHRDGYPLPSGQVLAEIVGLSRAILFPGYYGNPSIHSQTIRYHIGVNVERLHQILTDQIMAGLCFDDTVGTSSDDISAMKARATDLSTRMIERLPYIRSVLATDVVAAYNGDPAAKSHGEVISCYPVIKALVNYRIAHELHLLGVPLIPRMLTEMAHSETGIDIHPAAEIGNHFAIDHGTGVVIGATCIIGNNVKLYQGVTLGARNFPLDENGNPIKGVPRHPIIEDNVVVYANATVLGRVTIGEGCVVGANEWVTTDMKPNTRRSRESEKQ